MRATKERRQLGRATRSKFGAWKMAKMAPDGCCNGHLTSSNTQRYTPVSISASWLASARVDPAFFDSASPSAGSSSTSYFSACDLIHSVLPCSHSVHLTSLPPRSIHALILGRDSTSVLSFSQSGNRFCIPPSSPAPRVLGKSSSMNEMTVVAEAAAAEREEPG